MNDLISRSALLEKVQFRLPIDNHNAEVISGCVDITRRLIEEAPTIEAEPVVRCCECKRRYDADECPMCFLIDGVYHEYTNGNGYCDRGERRNGDG